MQVDIWSDVVCPWCYIGKRRFEIALADFAAKDDVTVVYHSFELDPTAPHRRPQRTVEHLAQKYNISVVEAQEMDDRVAALAAEVGIRYDLSNTKSGNTFDLHRLLHLAGVNELQPELKERLLAAYFTEGLPVTEHATLTELAVDVGLDREEVIAVLESDLFAAEVRGDEGLALQLGISGVPYFVFDQKYGVSGAQSVAVFARVLEQVAQEA